MSQTHIRVPKEEPPVGRAWLVVAVVGIALTLVAILCVVVMRPHFLDDSDETAAGTILATRIDKVGLVDGGKGGGYILYRIEAHVSYSVHGAVRDRWIPASNSTSDRNILQMELLREQKTCLVAWAPHYEENARCYLD